MKQYPPHLTQNALKRRVMRQIAGARARRSGSELEEYLDRLHDGMEAAARGVVMRAHPKVAGKPGFMRIVSKGGTDYVGTAYGIPVAFDAKSTDDPASFHLDPKAWRQSSLLANWQRCGGVGFFLVYARARQIAYLVMDVGSALTTGVILRDAHRRGTRFAPHVPWVSLSDGLDWLAVLCAMGHITKPEHPVSPAIAEMARGFREVHE